MRAAAAHAMLSAEALMSAACDYSGASWEIYSSGSVDERSLILCVI